MEVYEFQKCLLTRLEESESILCDRDVPIPSSRVRAEWAYFTEIQIEPTGWQAVWKMPRVICEELNIKYPTIVFGSVLQVLFNQLKAIFRVESIEDEDFEIPETQEVNLIELWPTKKQENYELNVEKTADCIDKLRFFFTNVWMPWDYDNDDDLDWAEKHLESRIRFFYDLKRKDMKRSLAAHVRTLLIEARYIQQRREYIEIGISDDDDDELNSTDKSQITDLMRLHLRLSMIKNEIELLENPVMRGIYEEIKFDNCVFPEKKLELINTDKKTTVYIITKPNCLEEQQKFIDIAKRIIEEKKIVQMCSKLQDALSICNESDQIYLPPGKHFIKFLEYLNESGIICGLTNSIYDIQVKETFQKTPDASNDIIIISQDDDSVLLVFDGDFILENLTLDCRNVRCGMVIKNGTIHLKNCRIYGESKSSTRQGITVSGESKLIMENSIIQDFSTGLILHEGGAVKLNNSAIYGCRIGIEIADDTKIEFENSIIMNSKKCGIYFETRFLNDNVEKKRLYCEKFSDVEEYFRETLPWTGNCEFRYNQLGNIVVYNQLKSILLPGMKRKLNDSFENVRTTNGVENGDNSLQSSTDNDIITIDDSVCETNDSVCEIIDSVLEM